jgi:Ser/Thr protein kinase RdoA (MazF antagonist)
VAARLLRRFHDATAGSELAGDEEVVCHNDFAPWNTVFVVGSPVAMIDFDGARPGPRIRDLSYALWCWLGLGSAQVGISEQARRMRLMCLAYGLDDIAPILSEIANRQREIRDKHARNGWIEQARRVATEREWLRANRMELLRMVGRGEQEAGH